MHEYTPMDRYPSPWEPVGCRLCNKSSVRLFKAFSEIRFVVRYVIGYGWIQGGF